MRWRRYSHDCGLSLLLLLTRLLLLLLLLLPRRLLLPLPWPLLHAVVDIVVTAADHVDQDEYAGPAEREEADDGGRSQLGKYETARPAAHGPGHAVATTGRLKHGVGHERDAHHYRQETTDDDTENESQTRGHAHVVAAVYTRNDDVRYAVKNELVCRTTLLIITVVERSSRLRQCSSIYTLYRNSGDDGRMSYAKRSGGSY